eukprot:scaffold132496_cov24-Phaeocystis_antarctica.AAC.1
MTNRMFLPFDKNGTEHHLLDEDGDGLDDRDHAPHVDEAAELRKEVEALTKRNHMNRALSAEIAVLVERAKALNPNPSPNPSPDPSPNPNPTAVNPKPQPKSNPSQGANLNPNPNQGARGAQGARASRLRADALDCHAHDPLAPWRAAARAAHRVGRHLPLTL